MVTENHNAPSGENEILELPVAGGDVDVIIDGDKTEVVSVEKPAAAAAPVVTADEGVEALKRQIAQKDMAVAAAEAARREAEQRAHVAQRAAVDGNINSVSAAIDAAKIEAETAEKEQADAFERGDYRAASQAGRKMAQAEARIMQLEQGKTHLEQQRAAPPQQPQQSSDPVEKLASQLSGPSAAWVRAHPQVAHDQALFRKMVAAHHAITQLDGIQADTPEYFAAVEQKIGLAKPAAASSREAPVPAAPPTPVGVSASGQQSGSGRQQVRLSAAEVEIAKEMGMTPTEYAREKLAAIKEGKIGSA
jgi:hypothetical protein